MNITAQAKFTALMHKHFNGQHITVIEIGTASGLWTEYVLRNYKNCMVYTIDPYKHFPGQSYEAGKPQSWHDKICASADKKFLKHGPENGTYNNLVRIFKTSEDALPYLPDMVDVVYIDGNHQEEFVRFDIENYYPKVRKGGLFAGHDYNIQHIREIVDERFGDRLNVFNKQRIWWLVK